MKFLITTAFLLAMSVSWAAEPVKKTEPVKKEQKAAPAKKNCDMLKDKNCDKAAPSANKPIPKKKKEEAK
jgi:hypothetical protein